MRAVLKILSCTVLLVASLAGVCAAEQKALHSFKKLQLSDTFFCEGASFGDFNHDGVMDLVAGPYWYAGPSFTDRHEYYEPKPYDTKGFSDSFFKFPYDVNGDGWTDIVMVGFPGKEAYWFDNPHSEAGHWKRRLILKTVDNESPAFTDLTGDGKPELVCDHGGHVGYVQIPADLESESWTFHPITEDRKYRRFTHGLGVGDLNQDGRLDVLHKEGWWEQPAPGASDALWKFHPVAFSEKGGAQMHVVDIEGDGDPDVVTSKDAHGHGLAWFENTGRDGDDVKFNEHSIMGAKPEENEYGVVFSKLHAVAIADMDHDGVPDIITGRRGRPDGSSMLYWFQTVRGPNGVQFVPHRIDANSGVGTQVVVGDFNGDKWDDIVVGNKRGTFAFTHVVKDVDRSQWEAAQPKPAKRGAAETGR